MMDIQAALGIHQLARIDENWHRRQHIPFGHGGGTHAVVYRPSRVQHDVQSVLLSALVQTENRP
jgi:hypothetical protein